MSEKDRDNCEDPMLSKIYDKIGRCNEINKSLGENETIGEISDELNCRHSTLLAGISELHSLILKYPEVANEFYRDQKLIPSIWGYDQSELDRAQLVHDAVIDLGVEVLPPKDIRTDIRTKNLLHSCYSLMGIIRDCHQTALSSDGHYDRELILFADDDLGITWCIPECLFELFEERGFEHSKNYYCSAFVRLIENIAELNSDPDFVYLRDHLAIIITVISPTLENLEGKRKSRKIDREWEKFYNGSRSGCIVQIYVDQYENEPPTRSNILDAVDKKIGPQIAKLVSSSK